MAPDGRFLLVETGSATGARQGQFTLVLNWFDELQRRVPARPIAGWR